MASSIWFSLRYNVPYTSSTFAVGLHTSKSISPSPSVSSAREATPGDQSSVTFLGFDLAFWNLGLVMGFRKAQKIQET